MIGGHGPIGNIDLLDFQTHSVIDRCLDARKLSAVEGRATADRGSLIGFRDWPCWRPRPSSCGFAIFPAALDRFWLGQVLR